MKQFTSTNVDRLSRRDFLKLSAGLGLVAASMPLLQACGADPAAPPVESETLETTTIKLVAIPSVCFAPQYLAQDILYKDGFTDVQYLEQTIVTAVDELSSGTADMSMGFSGPMIIRLDTTQSLVMLAGVHVGCFVLFGSEQVNTIQDLKGRSVGITGIGTSEHSFVSSMVAYVGMDPNEDVEWAIHPLAESKQLFADGKIDAFLAFPPVAQELRAKKIGHEVVNSMMDDPWSQYFCCVIIANREFAQKNPVTTKRVTRAILKASDICALEPQRAAKFIVEKGYTSTSYDYALEAMQEIPYNRWREYDPEDTVTFYANRLRDAGLIQSNANEIVAKGTDWRFLNEIKKELKG